MIQFACPGCSHVFSVGDEKAGKTGKCPKCSAQFVIPDAEPSAVPSAPVPSSSEPQAVEINPCPSCQAKLTVSPTDLGLDVECPYCKKVYTAKKAGASAASEERPSRRSRSENEDDDDRPNRRRDRYDDDDDDDDRPRGKRRRRSYEAHRGGVILTLGILAFFVCGIIMGPIAWFMGSSDLKAMKAGRMDPEGEGITQAGRICGLIAFLINACVILFYCVIVGAAIAGGAAGPGRR